MKLFSILAAVLVAAGVLSLTEATSAKGSGGGHSSGGSSHGAHSGSNAKSGHSTQGGKNTHNAGKGNSSAHGHSGQAGHGHHGTGKPRNWNSWSRYCWFPAYNCYGYFCSCDNTWYYWYGPSDCFLPISDMPNFPPDSSAPPMLPPGATEIR